MMQPLLDLCFLRRRQGVAFHKRTFGGWLVERVDAAMALRAQAERLRQIASNESRLSPELTRMAHDLDDQARKLEAAAIRDLGKKA